GPLLVAVAIDRGIPAVEAGHPETLVLIVIGLVIAGCTQAFFYWAFVSGAGTVGQSVVLDLRERVFEHFQRLSLAFHERYTSGRVLSGLTSDLDAINELLEMGLDIFVTSVLSVLSVGVILLILDLPLGLVAISAFVPLLLMTRWFQTRSTAAYRRTREA